MGLPFKRSTKIFQKPLNKKLQIMYNTKYNKEVRNGNKTSKRRN